ncbi:MAG: hypothetical protein U0X20_17650 [Caldilineaceae bacterium]
MEIEPLKRVKDLVERYISGKRSLTFAASSDAFQDLAQLCRCRCRAQQR